MLERKRRKQRKRREKRSRERRIGRRRGRSRASQPTSRPLSLPPVSPRSVQGDSEGWGRWYMQGRYGEECRATGSQHVERWGHSGDLMLGPHQCPEQDLRQFLDSQHVCLLRHTQSNLSVFFSSNFSKGWPHLYSLCLAGLPLTLLHPHSSDSAARHPNRWFNTQTQRWAASSSPSPLEDLRSENKGEDQVLV